MSVKICCIKLSLAARIIAMIGLITSVLVLTQLSTELVADTSEENRGGTVSILLGLDVDDFISDSGNSTSPYSLDNKQALTILIPFLLFAFMYAAASAVLIWGSIVEVSYYTYPWLFCEVVSFGSQIATLAIHGIRFERKKDKWIIFFSVCNLFLSVYFWVVVFCAQRLWARERKAERENASTSTLSSGDEAINEDEPPSLHHGKCVQWRYHPVSGGLLKKQLPL